MIVVLNVARFSGFYKIFGFFSMMFFKIAFWFSTKNPILFKLMGTGKNGTFDIHPDYGQWAYMIATDDLEQYYSFWKNSFYEKYLSKFTSNQYAIFLEPMVSHGFWDKKQPFGTPDTRFEINEPIAVLTRASIRFSKLKNFWQNVPAVANNLNQTPGLLYSIGIGEAPFIKQATMSLWQNEDSMKAFAYKKREHNSVISKTKKQDWYSEEMFTRFRILGYVGETPNKIKERFLELA
jgi:hypothetical protein